MNVTCLVVATSSATSVGLIDTSGIVINPIICALARRSRVQESGQPRAFAMAFIDVRMPPGMDGVQTIKSIWEVDPDLQVVLCTAFSDYSFDQIIQELGSSDQLLILKKPFDPVEVRQLAGALTW